MMFRVVAEFWDYYPNWPKKCTVVAYKKGHVGFLPESVVIAAEAAGDVVRI
jgi:hypothetical protein